MNNPINDGGSAFPSEQGETQNNEWNQTYQPGMTLRDWFAGKVLNGYLSGRNNNRSENPSNFEARQVAMQCYAYADAMLAERLKGGEA